MKPPSESTLWQWWRKAVRAKWGERCVWPECTQEGTDTHHFEHRKFKLLRYDVNNGLPLCHAHHEQADRTHGRETLRKLIDVEYLASLTRYVTIKDYLIERGMTEAEFLCGELDTLKRIVKYGR